MELETGVGATHTDMIITAAPITGWDVSKMGMISLTIQSSYEASTRYLIKH